MKEEIWKVVPNYERYSVSNKGRIKGPKGIMKLSKAGEYKEIWLYGQKQNRRIKVHRLVAELFLPNPDNLPYINHKDENKSNNSVDNLEWCTASYNAMYSYNLHREKRTQQQLNRDVNIALYQYTLDGTLIKKHISINEAKRFNGIDNLNDEALLSHGYVWSRKPLDKNYFILNKNKFLKIKGIPKKVYCIDKNFNVYCYNSQSEAARDNNTYQRTIWRLANITHLDENGNYWCLEDPYNC